MGSEVVSSYLRSKFSSSLREAEAEADLSKEMISRFRFIESLIDSRTSQTELYQLIDALSDCTLFSLQRRSFKALLFENKMRRLWTKSKGGSTSQQAGSWAIFRGFDSEVAEIRDLLGGQQFMAIGIVGRCGSGKTALAQQVFTHREIENEFSPRIWVPLSQFLSDHERSDLGVRIVNYILSELGIVIGLGLGLGLGQGQGQDSGQVEYGDYGVVKLLERLQLELMEKRYLIVLDDAWRMDEWFADLACKRRPTAESFTHGLPKGSGGVVIVTTRSESVMRGMVGETHVIRPRLGDDHCWEFVSDAVRQIKSTSDDPKLINMEKLINE